MSSPPVFSGVCVAKSLVFCVMFYRSLSFVLWPSLALNILDLRLLVIAWVFSNFSCLNGQVGAGAAKLLNIIAQFASKWNLTFLFQKVKGNVNR